MKTRAILFVFLGAAIAVFAGVAAGASTVGTAFTYQGSLNDGGAPADDVYDLLFSLFDAATDGNQIGSTLEVSDVTISEGKFTAALAFGDMDYLNGEARWLEIGARPDGDGSYTTLIPRQELTPAPYALALPGVRTEQNTTSPNIIGGYAGNAIDPDIVGSVIGGGGCADSLNMTEGNFAVICGGSGNTVKGKHATVGGGKDNRADGDYSVIDGGKDNTVNADGDFSAIGGGHSNTIQASNATISGGRSNTIGSNGYYSAIIAGEETVVNNWGSLAVGSYVSLTRENTVCLFRGNDMNPNGSLWINRDSNDGNVDHPIVVGADGENNGNGAYLSSSGTWTSTSSRTFKTNFQSIDRDDLLGRIRGLTIESWVYKGSEARRIGPCAEDFYKAFDRAELGTAEEKYLSASDVAGVSLAALKALDEIAQDQSATISLLEDRVAALELIIEQADLTAANETEPLPYRQAMAGLVVVAAFGLLLRRYSRGKGGGR